MFKHRTWTWLQCSGLVAWLVIWTAYAVGAWPALFIALFVCAVIMVIGVNLSEDHR